LILQVAAGSKTKVEQQTVLHLKMGRRKVMHINIYKENKKNMKSRPLMKRGTHITSVVISIAGFHNPAASTSILFFFNDKDHPCLTKMQ